MTRGARAALTALCASIIAAVGALTVYGAGANRRDLLAALGPPGPGLLADAAIATWQFDPDYKPWSYYWVRDLTQTEFVALATGARLVPKAIEVADDAAWKLPADLTVPNWHPRPPAGVAGLDARGRVGRAGVSLRWWSGRMYAVASPEWEPLATPPADPSTAAP